MEILDENLKSDIYNWSLDLIIQLGLSEYYSYLINSALLTFALITILYAVDFMVRKVLLLLLINIIHKSKTQLDDLLIHNKVLQYLTHIVPIFIAKGAIPLIFTGFPNWINVALKITDVTLILTICILIQNILKAFRDLLRAKSAFADKPLDSYVQVASIALYGISGIFIYSIITGNSAQSFLVSLGAASAILMLVFKDSILGFVASIQVSSNDMVRVGDWIEMSKYGADGNVVQINLSTVKVQNFDKTITTIPTYALISDSFKNYRGMQNAGGRRIKRSINIKMSSIRFLEEEEIEKLKSIQILKPYIEQRSKEIAEFNAAYIENPSVKVNGRNLTNIGLFREYIKVYTQQNPNIHKEYHFIVRQMQPTEHGVPLELFMFTNTTVWADFENITADIFDHLFAVISFFKLEIFELPASDDVRKLIHSIDIKKADS
ncbi:mechanosensitive ion channel family protein [Faecalibacter rhinopitheci]|uniref:Mechanosensing system component YbdG n=1 Tax=Faecalibacter rhinopitheci TaxID=2779678 RepID=A0A8J7G6S3_9FLAO|nr:mechanosensitive ion channel domain-containing protein [Faecalibacter rhinopitheci]MBF0597887.1 mechanosensitive ion channel [Faecalibacter rhinopitheci]